MISKTKFILHGGFTPGGKWGNDELTEEILKNMPQQVRILLVYFAKEPDRIPKNYGEDVEQFNNNKKDKELFFDVAEEGDFRNQVIKSDVVYFHGGSSLKLLGVLKNFPDLREILTGKVVVGDSAGANVLCKVFYRQSAGEAMEGMGILPIKIVCHYQDAYKDKVSGIYPDLKTVFLKEYTFEVHEQ
ncbi:MAG: Type 1 glutamine amidotransferase-like domain-containing protein [Candidatus Paceibacterota bacterium]